MRDAGELKMKIRPIDFIKKRNKYMDWVQKNDPERFRTRNVEPEKGRGRKNRPRNRDHTSEYSAGGAAAAGEELTRSRPGAAF